MNTFTIGEEQSTASLKAKARANQIRSAMRAVVSTQRVIADTAQDWKALGYASWEDYADHEYGMAATRLSAADSRRAIAALALDAPAAEREQAPAAKGTPDDGKAVTNLKRDKIAQALEMYDRGLSRTEMADKLLGPGSSDRAFQDLVRDIKVMDRALALTPRERSASRLTRLCRVLGITTTTTTTTTKNRNQK